MDDVRHLLVEHLLEDRVRARAVVGLLERVPAVVVDDLVDREAFLLAPRVLERRPVVVRLARQDRDAVAARLHLAREVERADLGARDVARQELVQDVEDPEPARCRARRRTPSA